jgi:protein gp37
MDGRLAALRFGGRQPRCERKNVKHPAPPKVFIPGDGDDKKAIAKNWKQPLEWNREAEKTGTRTKVFVYHPLERVSQNSRVYNRLWWKVIAATPHLDWLLITANPGILEYDIYNRTLSNVWMGVSIHDATDAPKLLELLRLPERPMYHASMKPAAKFV